MYRISAYPKIFIGDNVVWVDYFSSPNYPENYANNSTVVKVFDNPNKDFGAFIQLQVVYLNLEPNKDFLRIQDFASQRLLASLTGYYGHARNDALTYYTSGSLVLKFHSDESVTRSGFLVRIQWVTTGSSSNCFYFFRAIYKEKY